MVNELIGKNVNEIAISITKIEEAIEITKNKQLVIDQKKKSLSEQEIEAMQNEKEEYDEMTINALLNAKMSIQEAKKAISEEKARILLPSKKEKSEVQRKLRFIKSRNPEYEKLLWAERSAKKALNDIEEKMIYQNVRAEIKYLKRKKIKLNEYERKTNELAAELGIESNELEEMLSTRIEAQLEQEKIIQEMADGREKREQERYEEMINEAIKEEEEKMAKESDKVEILYAAKNDTFLIKNLGMSRNYKIDRKDLNAITIEELANKMNIEKEKLESADPSTIVHLKLLCSYDEKYKTNKASQYLKEQEVKESRKEKVKKMKEILSLDIKYNLESLYEDDKFSEEEIKEILDIANNAQNNGSATVNKGIKVSIIEKMRKIRERFLKAKTLKLPFINTKRARKREGYSKMVNGKYMQSLDKEYEKALKEIHKMKRKKKRLKRTKVKSKVAEQQVIMTKKLINSDRKSGNNTRRDLGTLKQYVVSNKNGKYEKSAKSIVEANQSILSEEDIDLKDWDSIK